MINYVPSGKILRKLYLSTFGAYRPAYANSTCRQPAGAGIDRYGHLEIKGSEERKKCNMILPSW